jgi:Arc/MetJ-type ribon-helix-helix transcriptional regulator
MTIHLPKDVESGILAVVASGRFASVDAAMAEAASLLLQQLQRTVAQEPASTANTQEPKPIWDEALELTADVPAPEWDKLPRDLAEQHDHYIYGTPRRPTS